MDEDLERVTGTINPHGIGPEIKAMPNLTPEQAQTVLALGAHTANLLDATTRGATAIRNNPEFAKHVSQVIDRTNERGLFPGNTVLTNASRGATETFISKTGFFPKYESVKSRKK